jgi:glyoxylate/hydroxypyruvate reductase A
MHVLLRIDETKDDAPRWHAALRAAAAAAEAASGVPIIWHAESTITESIAREIEVAVVANPPPGALIGFPKLKFVQSTWAGVDELLDDASVPRHLVIARMVDPALAAAMAETALWATLSLHRGFFRYAQQQARGRWEQLPQTCAIEVRVTVLGMGEMGRAVATRLVSQGYQVRGWRLGAVDKHTTDDGGLHANDSRIRVELGKGSLTPLLAKTDILINLLPLTSQTRGIIDREFLFALPPGAALVNLARGGHLVEADLIDALNKDQISHAVLDVFTTEPLPIGHDFWHHPRVTILPHAAALTNPDTAAMVVSRQLRKWQSGQPVAHQVERSRGY